MWSEEEKEYLKDNYRNKSANMIAKQLDRTRNAVYQKAQQLGLESDNCGLGRRWTEEEIEKLKEEYPVGNTLDLAKELNRSVESIRNKSGTLGIHKKKKMNRRQKAKAKSLFQEGRDVEEIARELGLSSELVLNSLCTKERLVKMYNEDNLSQKEIGDRFDIGQSQVSEKMADFGIETEGNELWTEREEKILKENYLEVPKRKLMSLLPNRTWEAIKLKALKLGVSRTAEEYRKSEDVVERLKAFSEKRIIKPKFGNTEVLSYILGVLDGDGFCDKKYTIGLEVISERFANKFSKALKEIGLNPGRGERENKEQVWSSSVRFIEWYLEMRKEKKLEWLLEQGDEWLYIEGRYESDGNIHPSGAVRITSTNDEELEFISKILSNLGIECNLQQDNVWICKSSVNKFFNNINPVIKKRDKTSKKANRR